MMNQEYRVSFVLKVISDWVVIYFKLGDSRDDVETKDLVRSYIMGKCRELMELLR